MAKVIEFYIPKNFRKPFRTAAQAELGKVIEFAQRQRDPLSGYPPVCGLSGNMSYVPPQTGFMHLEDSATLSRAIFPNYASLVPCHSAPSLEPENRSHSTASVKD